eukprot:gene25698-49916_t
MPVTRLTEVVAQRAAGRGGPPPQTDDAAQVLEDNVRQLVLEGREVERGAQQIRDREQREQQARIAAQVMERRQRRADPTPLPPAAAAAGCASTVEAKREQVSNLRAMLDENQGKSEGVRRGLQGTLQRAERELAAMEKGAQLGGLSASRSASVHGASAAPPTASGAADATPPSHDDEREETELEQLLEQRDLSSGCGERQARAPGAPQLTPTATGGVTDPRAPATGVGGGAADDATSGVTVSLARQEHERWLSWGFRLDVRSMQLHPCATGSVASGSTSLRAC